MRLFRSPVLCNYYLTFRCNARCSFCDIWEKPSPYVTDEAFEANLRDLKRMKVRVIDFTGGEPLLHRRLDYFLRRAKEEGFITTVTTNALLYPKLAERLKGLIDMLHFSLDSADAERHNASRGVACFDHFMRSIEIARSLGEKPDVLFTVMDENVDEIEQVYREITQPNGLILILNPIFNYNEVGGSLSPAHFPALHRWGRQPNVYLNDAFLTLRLNGGNQIDKPVCVAGSSTVVISPEDELVLPCYHLGLERFPIQGRLWEVWHSPEVQKAVALEGRHEGCQGCAVNCYMQPSFAFQVNRYFFRALPSTLKYSFEKWVYA